MTLRMRLYLPITAAALVFATSSLSVRAQSAPQDPRLPVALVAATALEPLLPVPAGWNRARSGGNRVVVSEECGYTFADAVYEKDGMKVRVMLADTGRNEESLGLIATMVVSLPDGYTGTVPPATTVTRLLLNGVPAASRWDAGPNEGEFVAVVGGRFVAKAEGTHIDSLATLRALVELVDLKKLGELK